MRQVVWASPPWKCCAVWCLCFALSAEPHGGIELITLTVFVPRAASNLFTVKCSGITERDRSWTEKQKCCFWRHNWKYIGKTFMFKFSISSHFNEADRELINSQTVAGQLFTKVSNCRSPFEQKHLNVCVTLLDFLRAGLCTVSSCVCDDSKTYIRW